MKKKKKSYIIVNMIVLSGASASGKTEVAKVLAAKYGIVKVITTTTRPMRKGEVNGKDYFFVSVDEFEEMVKDNKFVEYTVYNGNFYGSTKDQVGDNKVILTEPNGVKSYKRYKKHNIVTFFLLSNEATRYERMLLRGDGKENSLKRIASDREVFSEKKLPKFSYYIESEESTVEQVADVIYAKYQTSLKRIDAKRKKS